jgi:membrane-associated phospholipid phosphatase
LPNPRNTIAASVTRRLSLAALTAAATGGVIVFRVLGTRTTFGYDFDVSAILNGLTLGDSAKTSSNALLVAVSSTSFALIGGLLIGVSLLRRRLDLALAVGVTLAGSFATTEFLKATLDRSDMPDYLAKSFPSGHSTVALALGLSYVLLTPRRKRWGAAAAATVYAAAMGAALVFNAWHLPSDVGGGFCVATAWAAASAQLVRRPVERGIPPALLAAAVVVVALAGLGAVLLRPGLSFTVTVHGRLPEAVVGIVLTAAVCCAAFAYAIAARSAVATRS